MFAFIFLKICSEPPCPGSCNLQTEQVLSNCIYIYIYIFKELPRVNREQDPVEDRKSQLLSFSEILLEFCSMLVKVYKNVHFTEFHSVL